MTIQNTFFAIDCASPAIRAELQDQSAERTGETINSQELTDLLPYLHRFACSLTRNADDAADLVQDTVERALIKSHLFDGANLRAWLTTICKRIFLNNIRRDKSRGVAISYDDAPSYSLCTRAIQDDHMHFSDVAGALDRLTMNDKQVIALSALDGLKYAEIAEHTNVPIGTVRSRLSRARSRLVDLVEDGSLSRRAA
ncbi:RNA polymerase sigma factor [Hyphococcus luteus]|nr:RNA polymerase sigma factor [Marinicaulis flavus]